MLVEGPLYSGAAALLSLCFHQLAPKHVRHWGGDPTIMDAFVGSFHGKGQALYLNLGPRQRKTLTNGFTAVVDRSVGRNTLQACQWKGKHSRRQRLKWRKPGEILQGRECALRVKCGENHVSVTSVQMGMAYGFRGGVFEKFYVDRHTVVEYVDESGNVHQVPIRRGKDTSEQLDDCAQIRAIHVQAKRVSPYAPSRQASESQEESLSSHESCSSLPIFSSLSSDSESAELVSGLQDLAARLSTSGDEDGPCEELGDWDWDNAKKLLEYMWDEEDWEINKTHNKIAFDLQKLTGRMKNRKQNRIILNKMGSRSNKKMMGVLAVMKKYMLAKKKRDIIFGAMAMLSLHEGKAVVVKKNKAIGVAG